MQQDSGEQTEPGTRSDRLSPPLQRPGTVYRSRWAAATAEPAAPTLELVRPYVLAARRSEPAVTQVGRAAVPRSPSQLVALRGR